MKRLFTIAILLSVSLAQASGTFSLIEINPLHGNSPLTLVSDSAKTYYGAGGLTGFIELNNKLYLTAQSTPGDDELWVTDGTLQGTSLVKAINPARGAAIGNLVYVNNHIVFMATDNGSVWDLWSTDGSDTGTIKIDKLNSLSNTALGAYNVSLINNSLVFCAEQKLLITDGTAGGTDSLASIAAYAQGFGYCDFNGESYFVLPELDGGNEIWRTDGTSGGTEKVLDLNSNPLNFAAAHEMISFNGKLYLTAADTGQSFGLFTFDGTINGQLDPLTIARSGNANPHGLKVYNNALYFIASDGASSNVFRISSNNPTPVPLIPNSNFGSLSNLSFANNTAYCMDSGNKQIHAIELTGLTYSALNLQGYYLPHFPYQDQEFLIGANGQVFFEAYDSLSNIQVFMQSDFTNAGTQPLMPAASNTNHPFNCYLDSGIRDVFDLHFWGGKVIMPANFNDAGRELWVFEPGNVSSVEKVNEAETFAIYPNPTKDEVLVKTSLCGGCEQMIDVVTITGQRVMQKILNAETTSIQLSSFASGDYFVTLTENGKPVSTKKLSLVK